MNELHIPPVIRHKDSVIPPYYFNSPHNVNPHPYKYLYNNPTICAQYRDVFLLLMVKTTFAHYARRKTIRETWGAPYNMPNVVMPLVFLLGELTVFYEKIKRMIFFQIEDPELGRAGAQVPYSLSSSQCEYTLKHMT